MIVWKDNATFAKFFVIDINLDNRTEYIKTARAKYDSYDSKEWVKCGFDEHSGGYYVYHKEHHFDPTLGVFGVERGKYEEMASEVLMMYGMQVALGSEKKQYDDDKINDGLLNGKPFDIKGIEGTGKRNVEYKIYEASKQGAETVVLFYYNENNFSKQRIIDGYDAYLRNSKSKRIGCIYYVLNNKLYKL